MATKYHFLNSTGVASHDNININIKWHLPQQHWYKLNRDGAFQTNGNKLGIRGMFRNHLGNSVMGYQKADCALSPRHVELQVIHVGLQIATTFDLFPLEVETDSTVAIKAINQDHIVLSNTVHACRLLMLQQKHLLLRHNFREGNQVAHLLAKDATKKEYKHHYSDNPKLHASPPHFINQQLSKDANGIYYYNKSLDITACNKLRSFRN